MPKYKVLRNLKHNNKRYVPGKTVEMSEEDAAVLISRGVLDGGEEADVNPTGMQPATVITNDPASKKVDVTQELGSVTSPEAESTNPTEA